MQKNDLSVFEIEKGDFKLRLQKGTSDQTLAAATSSGLPAAVGSAPVATASNIPAVKDVQESEKTSLREIVSPMVGTFYRASSPEAPPFVDVGHEVSEETVVCIIEAMKVMNEIKAEVKGIVTQVLVENAKPVEFGQPMFKIRPT